MVGSPATSSVQWTLDGRILGEAEAAEEGGKAPCDEKCWRAIEKRCVCRCGGRNHGAAYRNLTSLDDFGPEGMPVVSLDIMRAKTELLWLARKDIVAAYTVALGGGRG